MLPNRMACEGQLAKSRRLTIDHRRGAVATGPVDRPLQRAPDAPSGALLIGISSSASR
ncbi:hypothetical protein DF3PB_4410006 [uncultured Defluviicoccus sp.]|uniref:Uncharacterized protein n=1 Tax=metagenome TaxID=256318 RepID=A0A380TH31_9ZZZZ|nr:hypothetical protein DF3PB_4410006 [uncultured Defluviicoccus sp.]